ncbi:hypothetical protein HPP92_005329 [Vanilla planifolia]|uniref:VQ domain-containing protein n=1 Tax=Vanilla planifolia TaxID=51239 RepID=A0A835V993_VANPL|nr:hypothetical protein HPP92_005647 [Vanilla planifolia]KAG0494335.1 hypothetical protein HPP92_005329 [Vanilla planifolia]
MDKPSATATATSDPPTSPCTPATTYVQTDATSFKELVQRLTGPHDEPASASSTSSQKLSAVRRPAFKLHERRQASRSKLLVLKPLLGSRLATGELGFSPPPGQSPLISPSTQFAALAICDGRPPTAEAQELNEEEEERAIRERRFYLHPSPGSAPRSPGPVLLPLFPLNSPATK